MSQQMWAVVWDSRILGCFDSHMGARMALSEACKIHRSTLPFDEVPDFCIQTGEFNAGPKTWAAASDSSPVRQENHDSTGRR